MSNEIYKFNKNNTINHIHEYFVELDLEYNKLICWNIYLLVMAAFHRNGRCEKEGTNKERMIVGRSHTFRHYPADISGSMIVNSVPSPGALFTFKSPPCSLINP